MIDGYYSRVRVTIRIANSKSEPEHAPIRHRLVNQVCALHKVVRWTPPLDNSLQLVEIIGKNNAHELRRMR